MRWLLREDTYVFFSFYLYNIRTLSANQKELSVKFEVTSSPSVQRETFCSVIFKWNSVWMDVLHVFRNVLLKVAVIYFSTFLTCRNCKFLLSLQVESVPHLLNNVPVGAKMRCTCKWGLYSVLLFLFGSILKLSSVSVAVALHLIGPTQKL